MSVVKPAPLVGVANHLEEIAGRFSSKRVAVLGDLMLDVYLWGKVTRISPEAPVPVVNIERRTCCLGGAANVMRNAVTLGAKSYGFGLVGADATGDEVIQLLGKNGIDSRLVLRDSARRTTEKKRVIAGGQQLFRADYEDIFPASDALRRKLVSGIIDLIRQGRLDAIIFEDYNKGLLAEWMLEEIIVEAKPAKVVTALDPKPGSMQPVKGITVIKPNRSEAFALANKLDRFGGSVAVEEDSALAEVATSLLNSWEPEQLLISLAAQGLAFCNAQQPQLKVIPTRAREVFDVSGAGDTVTATFALALVSGASPKEAAELANLAAGVVVAKVGTVPIEYGELLQAIRGIAV